MNPKIALPLVLSATFLAAPVLLIAQNYDDHDRSNRRTANSMGKMYLDSCDENAILFTIGDNDTFALWYAQNIEGYRQDIRIVNTSLFQTDWYIDDMKKKAFESDPIPSQLTHDKYTYGTRDFIVYHGTDWNKALSDFGKVQNNTMSMTAFRQKYPGVGNEIKFLIENGSSVEELTRYRDTINIKAWMNWVGDDSKVTSVPLNSGEYANTFPSKTIRVPVDKEAVLRNGIVKPEDADLIVPYIDIKLEGDFVYKNRMMMLDIIANNNWERPIYFSGGAFGNDDYIWMKDYLQLDGVVYKLVPIRTPVNPKNPFDMGRVDGDKMYDIVMNWDWGNSGSPNIYHDTETRRNGITYRSNLARLAENLIQNDKFDKAEDILDLAMEKMPVDKFEYYSLLEPYVMGYYQINKPEKARDLYAKVVEKHQEYLSYYSTLDPARQYKSEYLQEIFGKMDQYRNLVDIAIVFDSEEYARAEAAKFNDYLKLFREFFQSEDTLDVNRDEPDLPNEDSVQIPLDSAIED